MYLQGLVEERKDEWLREKNVHVELNLTAPRALRKAQKKQGARKRQELRAG